MVRSRLVLPFVALIVAAGLAAPPASAAPPGLTVTEVVTGASLPWDVTFLPTGEMLYTERDTKRVWLKPASGAPRLVLDNRNGTYNSGETGLMAIEADADGRGFFTCNGYRSGDTRDIRVVRWKLNAQLTAASVDRVVLRGLPITTGRHGGCALLRTSGTIMYVGTGDAATGRNPQNLGSLGGKVLRIDTRNGNGFASNPYGSSSNASSRRVWTYGHRNVQGLARRADGSVYSIEQGSYRDDEANWLVKGGNYGWNPIPRRSGDPSYNESANSPMTDDSLPGAQRAAAWRSGASTIAASGGTFVAGRQWGEYEGTLAIAALKDESLRFVRLSAGGQTVTVAVPDALRQYGRLRGVTQGPDGALYVTTSNGGGQDKILRITPAT